MGYSGRRVKLTTYLHQNLDSWVLGTLHATILECRLSDVQRDFIYTRHSGYSHISIYGYKNELLRKPLHLTVRKPKYFNQRAKYLRIYLPLRTTTFCWNMHQCNQTLRQIRLLAQTHTHTHTHTDSVQSSPPWHKYQPTIPVIYICVVEF